MSLIWVFKCRSKWTFTMNHFAPTLFDSSVNSLSHCTAVLGTTWTSLSFLLENQTYVEKTRFQDDQIEILTNDFQHFLEHSSIDWITNRVSVSTWARRMFRKQSSRMHAESNPRSRHGNQFLSIRRHSKSFFLCYQQVDYVSCQMVTGADRTHQACVEAFGVSWNEILQCVESEFATSQQLEYERITSKFFFHSCKRR